MVRKFLISLLVLAATCYTEDPWEGLHIDTGKKVPPSFSPLSYFICFHQQIISQADGPRSHFVPCSSTYMRQAVCLWGNWRGYLLGCDRLLRENNEEWMYKRIRVKEGCVKWDPVPRPARCQQAVGAP